MVAFYDHAFWRELPLSGSAISQLGPMVEIADQSDPNAGVFGLFGFIGVPAKQRQQHSDLLHDACLEQLVRLFGQAAATPLNSMICDWATEARLV